MRFVLLIAIAAGSPILQDDDRRLLKDARAALRQGNYEVAERNLRRLAEKRPDAWEPRRLLVRTLLETGKTDDAATVCSEFLKTVPNHAGARAAEAEVRLEQDEPARALETLEGLTSVHARFLRARALTDLGRDEEAVKLLAPFVEEHNRAKDELMKEDLLALARGLILYANLAMESEIYKQVVQYATPEILKADPQDPVVTTFLGDCYRERHNQDAAQRSYLEALGVNARYAPALAGLAELALDHGRPAEVGPLLDRGAPATARVFYLRAAAALATPDPGGARAHLTLGLVAHPRSPRLHSLLAAVAHLEEKTEERDAEIRKVLEVNPRSPLPYHEIGRALLGAGWQFQSANFFFKRAVDQNPRYWPALVDYGMNCLRLGDEETASKILRDANRKDPFDVRVQNVVNLLDDFEKKFSLLQPPHYRVRIGRDEQAWMEPYVLELLDRGWSDMTKRYGFTPKEPVYVDVFANHSDFSVRATGVPDLGALGICFGPGLATLSPRAAPQLGQPFNWGAVLWHELAHVFAVQLSEYRVPRWLTEGLSTYEESLGFGGWEREIELDMMIARDKGELGGVSGLESGRPVADPILALYHQGSWICEYIDKTHGFSSIVKLLRGYAAKKKTPDLFTEIFGLSLAEFDKGFFAWTDARLAADRYRLPPKEGAGKLQAEYARKKDAATAVKLCAALLAADDAAGAVRIGKEAVALAPGDPWAHATYGQALYKERRVEDAIEELEQATAKDPCDYATWYALGSAYMDEDRPKDAVRAFDQARRCFPRLVKGENAYRRMNEAHLALKDYDGALRDLEEMLAIDQLDFRNRVKVAKLRAERKDWETVQRVVREAAWIETRDRTLHDLAARAATELKDYERALRHHRIGLALIDAGEGEDDRVEKLCDIAETYLRMGDKAKARGYAQDALRLSPGFPRAKQLYDQAGP